ncbi:DUF6443 domain-containing protein [Muricauda sp. SCSIO 64092]|uniref:DUF6443 domain-containing protein n=1 Tax=Allomuricauda sp. SCSIO 64092 TaxID=2908842 RepID=UPI001FF644CE|nr:DUF6443 domain-containing protein [Muricauda sp. SCSIO 64092]UOY06000.1 DUF6443 domain-containing protein [Muricauda sp. SCSIO 64092]
MKHLQILVFALLISSMAWSQTSTENYIKTTHYKKEVQPGQQGTVGAGEKNITVTYFDGMGRPEQRIDVRAGGQQQDIVNYTEFDKIGRLSLEPLPCISSTSNGMKSAGAHSSFCDDFYSNSDYDYSYPNFSDKRYGKSPLNRVEKISAPGRDWRMGSGNEQEFEYLLNDAQEVRLFDVSFTGENTEQPQLVASGSSYYAVNTLIKNVYRNEDHSGTLKDRTREEFMDKQGMLVLKRNYENEIPHDTYYIYDDYDNLTFVVTPKVNIADGVSTTELNELCYQYKYDKRNRLIEKKLPGRGWESIVYNKLDQPVLTQDANLALRELWLFTKYDVLGRILYTGFFDSDSNRGSLQTVVDNHTVLWEEKQDNTIIIDNTSLYYTNNAFPTTSIGELHSITYYDAYVDMDGLGIPSSVFNQTITSEIQGLPTVTKTRVLDGNEWITNVLGYDEKGREIFSAAKNPFLNTTDRVEHLLDFTGNIQQTKHRHQKGSAEEIVIIDKFTYDEWDRLLSHKQCIGRDGISECGTVDPSLPTNPIYDTVITSSVTELASNSITLASGFHFKATATISFSAKISSVASSELIAENSYDALGNLRAKKVGHTAASPLQTYDYKYNIRGWLRQLNDPGNLGNDLFGFKVNYNEVDHGASPRFNGNIAEVAWKSKNDNTLRWYAYSYDALDRIKSATFTNGRYSVSNLDYDKNGNLIKLDRNGWQNSGSIFTDMDRLVFGYSSSSNKLIKVLDNGNDTYGFTDGVDQANEFHYDPNGNLIRDLNKAIGTGSHNGITYNHLDLPKEIKFNHSSSQRINYTYDASGNRLKKEVSNGAVTEYSNGFVYTDGALSFFPISEGYVTPNGAEGYDYVYQYTDHLENVRLSYSDANGDGSITVSTDPNVTEIIEENNYYPFGLKHKGYNDGVTALGNSVGQQWKFGDKQYEDNWDWDSYDFGARSYDPELGRWMSIDPLAEEMRRHSPYNYAFNNPIYYIDPDGMRSWRFPWADTDEIHEANDEHFNEKFSDFRSVLSDASIVVDETGQIIDAKDDGDDNIYLNERTAENVIGKEQKGKNYEVGDYLEMDDLFSSSLEVLPDGFLLSAKVDPMEFEVSPLIGGLKNAAKYVVYFAKGAKGFKYVGITNNFARRAAEHLRARGFVIQPLLKNLTKADARAVEQALIEIYKLGGKSGQTGQLLNKINSIAKTNPKYAAALKRGYELLSTIGIK